MSLVPFHLWTADVYEGAPTGVTAYLSVISKGAAAVALAIVLRQVFPLMKEDWTLAVAPAFRRQYHRGQPDGHPCRAT